MDTQENYSFVVLLVRRDVCSGVLFFHLLLLGSYMHICLASDSKLISDSDGETS